MITGRVRMLLYSMWQYAVSTGDVQWMLHVHLHYFPVTLPAYGKAFLPQIGGLQVTFAWASL